MRSGGEYASITGWLCLLVAVLPQCGWSAPTQPVFPDDRWATASPQSLGVDPAKLQKALNYLNTHAGGAGTDEMVIVRDGYLIWQGPGADRVHEIYSATKTFTSTVLGLLAAAGTVGIDDYAVKYMPSLDDKYPQYARIKLSHLASMTSGYDSILGDGWAFYSKDPARHVKCVMSYTTPGPPMFEAGKSFKYHDPGVHLLGWILTSAAGEPLEKVFAERVARPIGMKHFRWSNYGNKEGILFNNPAGTPDPGQGGVYSSPRDLARYGLLYLNCGRWKDRRILDPSFVDRATSNQVPAEIKTPYFDLTGRYGFYWWTNDIRADGTRAWPCAPPGTYAAHGAGRNFIFVIPQWRMVIVRLSPAPAGAISKGSVPKGVWEQFFANLKDALKQ